MYATRIALGIVALSFSLAGAAQAQSSADPQVPTTETTGAQRTTALNGRVFRALIQPMNNSTVTGTVEMQPAQTLGTDVTVSLVGAEPGTYYWHLHVGSCDGSGVLMGNRSAYRPIIVGDDGRASIKQTMDFPPPSGGNYHVIIHRSTDPANEGNIVACGSLLETGV
jgi:hypothetical protein